MRTALRQYRDIPIAWDARGLGTRINLRCWDEISFVVALETKRSVRDAFNDMRCVTPVTTFTEAYNKVSRYYWYPSNSS